MSRSPDITTTAPPPVDAATALSMVARELYGRGWMEGTSGNLSVRLDRETVLITASGRGKGRLAPADTVLVTAHSGEPVTEAAARPSAETAIHLALYRTFPDCAAVVHAHSPYTCAVASRAARAGDGRVCFTEFELIKGLGEPFRDRVEIPLFANWPHVPRIAADIDAHYASLTHTHSAPALLIAHHGATAWGADLAQARNHLECLEALCQLALLVKD